MTVVAAGITLHETLKAYDLLKAEGIDVRVIDLYSVKPVDTTTLKAAAAATAGRVVTVEDHWIEGGIGDAMLEAFTGDAQAPAGQTLPRVTKLAVRKMPGSGKPEELMDAAGISAPPHRRRSESAVGLGIPSRREPGRSHKDMRTAQLYFRGHRLSQIIQSRRRAKAAMARSCSDDSIEPGRSARMRWMASVGLEPARTR